MGKVLQKGSFVQVNEATWRGTRVIIKKLTSTNPSFERRFQREAQIASRLSHDNIVRLRAAYDAMLIYEFIDGPSLRQLLFARAPLPISLALNITRGILSGIAYAHTLGVYHLDLKPENVMLEKADYRARIVDFGSAKDVTLTSITGHGDRLGTPHYMAPEQFSGSREEPRSDIYSVAALMYEMLSGSAPYPNALGWLCGMAVERAVIHIPSELERLLLWGLERKPEDRPESAIAYLAALRKYQQTLEGTR